MWYCIRFWKFTLGLVYTIKRQHSYLTRSLYFNNKLSTGNLQCIKSVRIRSYSGPHFPAYSPNAGKCGHQNNSEYGLFPHSACLQRKFLLLIRYRFCHKPGQNAYNWLMIVLCTQSTHGVGSQSLCALICITSLNQQWKSMALFQCFF